VISRKNAPFLAAIPLFLLAFLVSPRRAEAQLHWDASVQAGGSARLFTNNAGGLPGSLGPVFGLEADVALLPLLRIGLYGDYEYADTTEPSPSSVVSFGARVKVMLPGDRNRVHWWLFTGFGAVDWTAPSYVLSDQTSQAASGATAATTVPQASGYFFEVPIGVGMGWRVARPWEIVAELQGRIGFDMNGSYFTQNGGYSDPDTGGGLGPTRPTNSNLGTGSIPTGNDVLAVLLTVGIGFDN